MFEERSLKLDVVALLLLAATVFLSAALVTYSPTDLANWQAAQSDVASSAEASLEETATLLRNACGISGAWVADRLFTALGFTAIYFAVSLGVVTVLLLMRREIDQPILRAVGWVMSLVAISGLLSLLLPTATPGPIVGAGGYLGALIKGLLKLHFAAAGAYILLGSVLLAGLLLATDYFLLNVAALATIFSAKGVMRVGQAGQRAVLTANLHKRGIQPAKASSDDDAEELAAEDGEWDENEAWDDEEEWDEETDEAWQDEEESAEEDVDDAEDEDDLEAEEADATDGSTELAAIKIRTPDDEKAASTGGVRGALASALGLKPKNKKQQRAAVLEELDAAVTPASDDVDYRRPPLDLLLPAEDISYEEHRREVRRKAKILEKTFADFGFQVKVVEVETGPVIAQYEVELEAGLRLSKITGLADDLAIALRVPSVRIVAPIPGKNTVGIEVPNEHRQLVRMREVIEEADKKAARMNIPIYLGKDVSGNPLVVDLTKLPHLLIAGRTGTGKSVCLNSIICSVLMDRGPDEVRMLMIDPKMVELSPYKKLPHLMHPVVTDMHKAEAILAWAVEKMEERYALLASAGVRHVSVYNQLSEAELRDRLQPEDEEAWEKVPKQLPFIVIVADEMADLMMTAGKDVESHIIRLAQKSRAVGIHLILATQKPTVDVITGLIKSNLPARIAFQVASRTDSRVVLDEMGADKLLGNGDMLYLSPGTSTLMRGQGTFLSDDEITRVVDFVGTDAPDFVTELVQLKSKQEEEQQVTGFQARDELYESAVDVVVREGRGSVSLLQRTLGIGYGRAARLIDFMAEDGIVGTYNGSQAREVLLSIAEWEALQSGGGDDDDPPPSPPPPPRSNRIRMGEGEEDAGAAPWEETPTPSRSATAVLDNAAESDAEESTDELWQAEVAADEASWQPDQAPEGEEAEEVADLLDEPDSEEDDAESAESEEYGYEEEDEDDAEEGDYNDEYDAEEEGEEYEDEYGYDEEEYEEDEPREDAA